MPSKLPRGILDAVIADAASQSGVAADEVQVVRAEAVTWRDGSLGCPEAGMFYTQSTVAGYWIELLLGPHSYDYRVDARGNYRVCPRGSSMPRPLDRRA